MSLVQEEGVVAGVTQEDKGDSGGISSAEGSRVVLKAVSNINDDSSDDEVCMACGSDRGWEDLIECAQ